MPNSKRPLGYIPPHLRAGSSAAPSTTPSVAPSVTSSVVSTDKSTRFIPPHLRGLDSSLYSSRISSSVSTKSFLSDNMTQETLRSQSASVLVSSNGEQPQASKLTRSNLMAAQLENQDHLRPGNPQKVTNAGFSLHTTSNRSSPSSAATAKLPQPTETKVAKPKGIAIWQSEYQKKAAEPTLPSKAPINQETLASSSKSHKAHPCSSKGCLAAFETFKGLKAHKKDRHYYCGLCNIDFEDDNGHLLHKIASDRHIVCPVCSADFSTSAGRDRHFKLFHGAEQNIPCLGCREIFKKAAALLDHIENNRCPQISSDMLERHNEKQQMKLRLLSHLIARGDDNPDSFDSEAGESVAGGVPLEDEGLPEDDEEAFRRAFPRLGQTESPPSEAETDLIDMVKKTTVEEDGGVNEWPPLGTSKREEDSRSNEWPPLGTNKRNEPRSAWGMGPIATPSRNFPPSSMPRDYPPNDLRDILIGHRNTAMVLVDEDGDILDTRSGKYNPETFRTAMNRFRCPYPGCGKTYVGEDEFTAHLNSPVHRGIDHRCPCCLKIFKSPSALISHMESPSTKCNIKESVHFERAVDLISGGFVEVAGKHEDGTARFKAAEPQW